MNNFTQRRMLRRLLPLAILTLFFSTGYGQYCIPSPGGGINYISNVTTTLGISNITNATGDDSYTDYTGTDEVSALEGGSINFTVTIPTWSSPTYCKIWVDWNQDGDFTDAGEEVYTMTTGGGALSFTGTITVPAGALTGTTRMRIYTDWSGAVPGGSPAIAPCVSTDWGEAEDYAFTVYSATPCESVTLNPGTISMPDSVCPDMPFTVMNTGSTVTTGMTRVWQSRTPSGTGTWTTIAGATAINYNNAAGISEPTDYRCIVTCTASGESDTTDVHTVEMSSPTDCYCTPDLGASNHFIVNAKTMFGATNFDNASVASSYTDYSDDHEVSAVQGTDIDIEVEACGSGSPYWCWFSYCKVWIDWNQDGDFTDPDEEVYSNATGTGAYSFSGTVTVPMTALPGATKMRILTNEAWSGAPMDPCVTDYWAGEAEDYSFVVIEALPCETLPLVAGTLNAPDSICPSVPFVVTNTGTTLGAGMERIWQVRELGTTAWTTITGAASVNYFNAAGITEAVEYRCIVNCIASGGSDTTNIDTVYIKNFLDCYCEPDPASDAQFIINVETDLGVTNIANATGPDGYTDYSATQEVSAVQGTSVDLTVQTCENDAPYWCWFSYCKAWVDWNQNGIFGDDPSEVVIDVTSGSGAYEFTTTINVPITAPPGETRMRILSNENWTGASFDPCLVTTWAGEVEDYAFEVIQATPCEDPSIEFPATALVSSLPAAVCGTGDIKLKLETVMPIASGITYQWQQSASAAGPWTNISPDLMLPPFDVVGVSSNTWFRCVIKCQGTQVMASEPLLVESVIPVNPTLTEGQTCGPGPVELTGDGVGILYWFEDATGGTPLGSGDTFITPEISTTTTFYAAAGAFPPAEIQIGTGTTSSWTWDGAPFGLGSPSSVGQFMYTAAQLTDAGAIPGIIDALSMNLTSLPGFPIPDYTISIKQVPATMTTLTWQTTGFTTIFGGPGYTFNPTATGWQSFPFSDDFFWDGESNIVVQVCYGAAAGTSAGGTHQYTNTPGQMLYETFWGATTSACGSTGTWTSDQLPNVIFNFPGCVSDRIPVVAHVRDTPVVDIPVEDGVYCVFNNTFDIPSTPEQPEVNTYLWSTGATDSFITVGPSSGTEVQYWVEVTNEWGCTSSDTLSIVLNPSPVVDLGPDTLVCEGGLVTLSAGSTGVEYYWSTGETTATIDVDDGGTYSVLVANEFGCFATDTVNVTVEGQAPTVEGVIVDNLDPLTYKFTPNHPANILSYEWDFGDGSPLSSSEIPTHTFPEPGTYLVTLKVTSDCGYNIYPTYVTIFTSANDHYLSENNLNIYPNPTSELLNIEVIGGLKMNRVSIINVVGQVLTGVDVDNKDQYTLDVSRLPSGMYYLKVDAKEGTIMKKFQVIK